LASQVIDRNQYDGGRNRSAETWSPSSRAERLVTTPDPAAQTRQSRMAEIAVLDSPRHPVVVAHAAEPAFGQVFHAHVVGSRAHFEAELMMAHLTTEPDSVKPVRENDGPDVGGLRIAVQRDVAIFSRDRTRCDDDSGHYDHYTAGQPEGHTGAASGARASHFAISIGRRCGSASTG